MKPTIKVTSILKTTLFIFSFLVLVGCVSAIQKFQDDMNAQGVKSLTGSEIQKLFSNAKEYNKSPKYEFEGYYSPDGKINGRVWGSWGAQADDGEWKVDSAGRLCVKYLGEWSDAGERCYTVYPGKAEGDYTLIKMTGSLSKGFPSGVVPIKLTPGM